MKISLLPGLAPDQVARLQRAGIGTCEQFLRVSRREGQLKALQKAAGLSFETLRDIRQRAELSQIRGVGPATLTHLSDVGVASLPKLAAQEPEILQLRLRATMDQIPNLAIIESWILQARREPTNHADVVSKNCCHA